jgi:hypothetical protein
MHRTTPYTTTTTITTIIIITRTNDESVPTEEALSESMGRPSASTESISAMSYHWLLRGSAAFTSSHNHVVSGNISPREVITTSYPTIPVEVLSVPQSLGVYMLI